MASIERTAYPRLKHAVSARELHEAFTPTIDEIVWARERARSPQHLLALVVLLKTYHRLGYFPDLFDVPLPIVEHIRGVLELKPEVDAEHDSPRTMSRQRDWIRQRLGVRYEPEAARTLAEQAIRAGALTKDNPADLINVALEELVRARLELPGYTTLDELAASIRTAVNTAEYAGIDARMSGAQVAVIDAMLVVDPVTRRSDFDRLKTSAPAATVQRFKNHVAHLAWLDGLGPTEVWLQGVPPAKVSHFAGEAHVTDASDLRRYGDGKRRALVVALLHQARVRARDEIATMFCKRMGAIHKRARERLEELREANRAESERLLNAFGEVLAGAREALGVSPDEEAAGLLDASDEVCARAGRLVLGALAEAGGVAALSAAHEAVSAHLGNNYLPLVERFYRSSRSALFDLLDVLVLEPTSAERGVLNAVRFLRGQRARTGEVISSRADGREVDLGFASAEWRKLITDRRRPGKLVRRHFEACVFSYLAAELRSGDIAVAGSESYANFAAQLLTEAECAPLIDAYCAEAGLPADAAAATGLLRGQLETVAAAVDAGYPHNADLVIDEGRPVLKRRRGKDRGASALALETALLERLPERGILDILTRTAYAIGWHRHFGPASGSDPKIRDALGRYVLLTFCQGANLGPAQVARHMRGTVSVHELSLANKHADAKKIHAASADVINAFTRLDMTRLWGDGSRVGADGTQIDTWSDNLLAETSIRYGGYGGIAYRLIADNYIALFSHFIPCGVWEAVHLLQGLLDNTSEVQPEIIHTDTQGQSLSVFGLSWALGFELLPRIRNWQDLIFYRPARTMRYQHIDRLFADDAVDWQLIETHWSDIMRVVLSIRAGRISSAALLRRLGNESRRNRIYRAFRELGRAVRTIVLLRYLSEPELREGITRITNRVEAFHGFSKWLMFGGGVLADNDPDHHEKIVKFNELLANCAIYSTTLDLTATANELSREGWNIDPDDLATVTPYITSTIRRFGDWVLDLNPPADANDGHLTLAAAG